MFFQVSKLGHYSEEIRRSLSEILLSVMNILLQKYKNIQSNNKRNVADQESFFIDGRLAENDFPIFLGQFGPQQNPDGEIENSGKSIIKIRIPNFCYIQVIVFGLSYLPVAAVETQQVRYHEKNVKNSFYTGRQLRSKTIT